MWPTLEALKALGGSASNEELLEKIIEMGKLPEEITSVMHKNNRQTRLAYYLAWSRTVLHRGGAIENSARGVWRITPKGNTLSKDDVLTLYKNRKKLIPAGDSEELRGNELTEDFEGTAWKDKLLKVLKEISPSSFERLAQQILRESGFTKVEVLGKSNDGGIDGVGVLQINLLSFRVYFQCKRYSNSVDPGAVRDFRGAMDGRSDKGILITTGTFTAGAIKEATRSGAVPIDLIDGDRLCDLLKSLAIGVKTELVEKVTVNADYYTSI
jgi:restriction system protein